MFSSRDLNLDKYLIENQTIPHVTKMIFAQVTSLKTEKETRQDIIDKKLFQAGWDVNDRTQVIEEFEIEVEPRNEAREPSSPYHNLQFSDYVLLGKDAKPLAVVEAKKTCKDAALGREQAKQCCINIQKQKGGELPFCFYSNGLDTFFWDLDNYSPRKIVGFPTRDDLEHFQYIRRNRKPLTPEDIECSLGPEKLNEEINTWNDVYGIEERYKAKCCLENDGKYWIEQIFDEWAEDGRTPDDFLQTLNRQTSKRPYADNNFLKKAFLDGCQKAGLFDK